MKKEQAHKPGPESAEDMLPEYAFDYRKARPNRFAAKQPDGSVVVVLDPDIAQVFSTPDSV